MRRFLTALFLVLAAPLQAQDNEIRTVIQNQMDAIAERDIGEAFGYASPMIQRLFGSPQTFSMMLQQGYPMVWDNAETRFLELREIDGVLWQKVMIRDARGEFHLLDYEMIEGADGWVIDGVRLLPPPDLGV